MTEISLPLNPWLLETVRLYRESRSDDYLRGWYQMSCNKGEGLAWKDFLVRRFLEEYLKREPFMRKSLALTDLPDKAKDILYWSGVDSLVDLVQITKEELDVIFSKEPELKTDVLHYLEACSLELQSYAGRTTKLSLACGYWTIPSPGTSHRFDIARPTLREEWFDRYYRRYGHFEDEEMHRETFERVVPICLDKDAMPSDYREFFQAVNNLFDAYADCCAHCGIEPRVERPRMPDKDVRSIYREALRAFIDIFERTTLLENANVGDYLGAPDDDRRLFLAEGERQFGQFQYLLVCQVECKIDIENIALMQNERLRYGWHRSVYAVRPQPLAQPAADAILRLRDSESDASLRARYHLAVKENPDLGWEEFLLQAATAEP